jgi:hypothetical protein
MITWLGALVGIVTLLSTILAFPIQQGLCSIRGNRSSLYILIFNGRDLEIAE